MARKKLSDRQLCRYYDICWYPDENRDGKFYFSTTVGTAADKQADKLKVTYPSADSEDQAIQLAIETLQLRKLYADGVRCYDNP